MFSLFKYNDDLKRYVGGPGIVFCYMCVSFGIARDKKIEFNLVIKLHKFLYKKTLFYLRVNKQLLIHLKCMTHFRSA